MNNLIGLALGFLLLPSILGIAWTIGWLWDTFGIQEKYFFTGLLAFFVVTVLAMAIMFVWDTP